MSPGGTAKRLIWDTYVDLSFLVHRVRYPPSTLRDTCLNVRSHVKDVAIKLCVLTILKARARRGWHNVLDIAIYCCWTSILRPSVFSGCRRYRRLVYTLRSGKLIKRHSRSGLDVKMCDCLADFEHRSRNCRAFRYGNQQALCPSKLEGISKPIYW